MRRRECEFFGFAALSSLKYAWYLCVLPPCKTGKFLFLCGRRFLLKSPSTAARHAIKDMPGVFLGPRSKADAAGIYAKAHCTLIVLSTLPRDCAADGKECKHHLTGDTA